MCKQPVYYIQFHNIVQSIVSNPLDPYLRHLEPFCIHWPHFPYKIINLFGVYINSMQFHNIVQSTLFYPLASVLFTLNRSVLYNTYATIGQILSRKFLQGLLNIYLGVQTCFCLRSVAPFLTPLPLFLVFTGQGI